ncbi:protein mono-ADP-ribosyltransferase PARP12-like [Lissotriton helveticus]
MWEKSTESEQPFMSDPAISSFLTQVLCEHGGRLAVSEIPQHLPLPPAHIASILREEASRFLLLESPGLVLALSAIRICSRERCQGQDCDRLHLCRFFALGRCTRKSNTCVFSHDIESDANKAVLKAHKISNLKKKDLQVLLLLNDPSFLPEVCKQYQNTRKDAFCAKGASCKGLHVCGFFVRGTCRNSKCSRSHNLLDPNNMHVLQMRGLSEEIAQNIQLMRIHQCNETQKETEKINNIASHTEASPMVSAPDEQNDPNEICLYHIWKFCRNQNKCVQVHYYLPYRWQVLEGTGEWKDLPSMEDIEKAYCDPNNTSLGHQNIDFQSMTSSLKPVHRLSTASSVAKPSDYLLTTEWIWYWKNEHEQWIEYGKHGGKEAATLTSKDLETTYNTDKQAVVNFEAGSQKYEIHFQEMIQRNLKYGTKKEVLRRPMFVSQEDVKRLKASGKPQAIPAYWDKTALPIKGYQLVDVHRSSSEFKEIEREFEKTMHGYSILKIRRIQNPSLWQVYQMQMKKMKTVNMEKNVLEKNLFHGTDTCHVDTICRETFDWRIYEVRKMIYGKGSYFSRDASYSHQYCQSSSSRKSMFLARVLVGDFVKGLERYTRPPPKSINQRMAYDSCVDNEYDPSIFVIFEKLQVYPDYILEYKENALQSNSQAYPENYVNDKTQAYAHANVQAYEPTKEHSKPQAYSQISGQARAHAYPQSNIQGKEQKKEVNKNERSCCIS